MPYAFILIGLLLVIVGIRNKTDEFHAILRDDLTGQNNFVAWMVVIFALGAIGTVKPLKQVADLFLVLVVLVLFLTSGTGLWDRFKRQIA